MKKMSTTVVKNGKTKTISVWLDERTVQALEQANDPKLTRQYILDEHNAELIDLKETRRHQSLSNGFDVIDERNYAERGYEISELNKALEILTDKQREIFIAHALERKSFREKGDEMGLHKQTVLEIYNAAIKKLKNFLN